MQRTIFTESRCTSESFSRGLGSSAAAAPSKAPARRGLLSALLKLLLLVVVCVSLYYAYQSLDAEQLAALKGLRDSVVVPLQGAVDSAATYLGLGSGGEAVAADGAAK